MEDKENRGEGGWGGLCTSSGRNEYRQANVCWRDDERQTDTDSCSFPFPFILAGVTALLWIYFLLSKIEK